MKFKELKKVIELLEQKMRIYTKTERYIIWENEDFTYQIQMVGEDIGSTVYDYAAEAIIAAEEMKK